LCRAIARFLNVFTHHNCHALHFYSVQIKRNREERPSMDIYKMLCRDALRKGAAFYDRPPFASIQSLRDYLRVVRRAAFLNNEEKRFGPR
jgi:hypothetical protein